MKLFEAVEKLKLKNRISGEVVYCPECNLAIAEGEEKVVAREHVRHGNCHRNWRKASMSNAEATWVQ